MPRRKYVTEFTVTTVPLPPEMRLGWEMAFLELWEIVEAYAAREGLSTNVANSANEEMLEGMEQG